MRNSIWKIILHVFLLQCCSTTLSNADDLNSEETTESVKTQDWNEHDDAHEIFLQRLQESYQNGTHELKELIESLSTAFSKRLDILENNSLVQATMHESLEKSSGDVRSQKLQVFFQNGVPEKPDKFSRRYAELDTKLEELNHHVDQALNNVLGTQALETASSNPSKQLIASNPRPRTPEECLSSLVSPVKGNSFYGKTIEQIAAEVPNDMALVVEIVNYLDVKMTDYRLYIEYGLEHQRAPTTVSFKTREVFTFKLGSRAPGKSLSGTRTTQQI
ncbi:unnamed protein product [Allacma fusca]|uniref:Uncharacterized protein n=1 Tax=Allacma fusca TaxID=39272 RepID=A0A8J2PEN7_9HEXA|nr:unnamed protein product [Allacma fusca]